MEIEYKIELYYRCQRLEDVLLKLPALADPIEGAMTTIELANNRCFSLPFTNGLQNASLKLPERDWEILLATRLIVPVDRAILSYLQEWKLEGTIDLDVNCVSLGCIYIGIRAGSDYLQLTFTADSSRKNRLFLDSGALQAKFINFLHETDGLFGILNLDRERLLLTDLDKQIAHPSAEMIIETVPDWDIPYYEAELCYNLDLYVAACLLQI
jgi:hypothetical protein